MECKVSLKLVDDYLGDCLDKATRQELERHLEQCASCQEQFALDRALRARLQAQLIGKPKAGFADRVLSQTVSHHRNKARHQRSFFNGAIAASVVIAATALVLNFVMPRSGEHITRQTLALHQVNKIALAMDSGEQLKGATLTLLLPDNVELKGFPGRQTISWKTDIYTGRNLLSLPIIGVSEKKGLLVARLEHGNKSKEYTFELSVLNQGVSREKNKQEFVVISRADFGRDIDLRRVGVQGVRV